MTDWSDKGRAECSLLGKWNPRLRLPALFVLAFAFSGISSPAAVIVMMVITCCCWMLSGLPIRYLLQRLRYPSLLIIFMLLILPFAGSGSPLFEVGIVSISREGFNAGILIAVRFYSILVLAIVFFGVAPLLTNIATLRALGLPWLMVDMALLMVRYLEVLKQDVQRLGISMRLRGFQRKSWSLKTLRTTSWLILSLLLHSYERAEGIYQAMRLRGYGQAEYANPVSQLNKLDSVVFTLVIVSVAGLLWLG